MIYRIIGEATKLLAEYCSGDKLSIVGPLGRGFDMNAQHPLIVGGGLGLAPLLFLASAFGKGKLLWAGVVPMNCSGQNSMKNTAR